MGDPLNSIISKYKSITITASFDETLKLMGLNMYLEEALVTWLNQLKITWKTYKRNPLVEGHIDALFRSRQFDAFRIGLIFVIKCDEYKDCKPKSLPYFIVEMLFKYTKFNNVITPEELKLPAFHIAIKQRNQHFLNLIVKTYQLSTIKKAIVPIVKDMLSSDNCRQASQIVIAMELFDEIPVEDLLFPLILQDKSNMIDDYLSQSPNQVIPFLLFMDQLLDKNFKLIEYVQNYAHTHNIHQIKSDKLHYKPLGKLVARLCNKFNIPIETCKNLSKNRTTSGLRYLIYQKYVEHNVSLSVWDDLVKDSLRQNTEAVYEFIDLLIDYDRKEALKWAKHFNIPDISLPLALKDVILNEPAATEENWDETKTNPQNFYETTLTKDQIEIIDSGEKFYDLLINNLLSQNIVSLDCEWKPSFGAKQSQVALIQLGTLEKVYIIDTILLNHQNYASFWSTFHKSFLDNAEIIKLGFGLDQDLREMKSIVELNNIKVKGEGMLDLSVLWKQLLSNGLCLPGNNDGGASLSSLVQSCFGKPLQKSEQCSNWELRPLRDTQIEYAATDAHVLIKIYYYLQNKCQEQGIKFEEICNQVMIENKKKSTKKPKVIDRLYQSFHPIIDSRPVKAVKLYVDPLLPNVLYHLRYCGIDSLTLPATMLWHDIIHQAISDERFVIVAKPKSTPNANFPQSSILCVGMGTLLQQLHKIINTYGITINPPDILSLCVHCNSKDLKTLSSDEVIQLCKDYNASKGTVIAQSRRYVPDDDEVDFGNFLSDSEDDEIHYVPNPTSIKPCVTTKGTQIVIENTDFFIDSQKPAILCNDCGKLFSEDDDFIKSIKHMVYKITKITF